MNNIIAELLISCIIISLLIVCVPAYRNSLEIITTNALMTFETNEEDSNFITEIQVSGADVISVIDYYSRNDLVIVTLTAEYGTKTYISKEYYQDPYPITINFSDRFDTYIEYANHRISVINYTKMEE